MQGVGSEEQREGRAIAEVEEASEAAEVKNAC